MCQVIEIENIGLHNVAEMQPSESGGWYLRRFPESVRQELSPLGRMAVIESAGVELRFVTESPNFRITLSSLPSVMSTYEYHNQDVFVFRGVYQQLAASPQSPMSIKQDAFDNILRDIVNLKIHSNLSIIEGSTILDTPGMLTVDMIHPSDYGHARIGMNLGRYLHSLSKEQISNMNHNTHLNL